MLRSSKRGVLLGDESLPADRSTSAPMIVWITDAESRFVLVNRNFEDSFQVNRHRLIGRTLEELFPKKTAAAFQAAAQGGGARGNREIHAETIPFDGHRRVLVVHRRAIRTADGKWSGVGCFAFASFGSAQASNAAAARLRECAILFLSSDGFVTSWDERAEQLFGYTAEQAAGRHISLIYSPEDIEGGVPAAVLRSTALHGIHESELWRVSSDGSRFRAGTVLAALACGESESTGFVNVEQRISSGDERRSQGHEANRDRAREQSHHSVRELNQDVLSSLPAHIAVVDGEGKIVRVNAAWERFALENGVSSTAQIGVGVNYLDVCRRASGPNSYEAPLALSGILKVLDGSAAQYDLEYPCHSPEEKRWFLLNVGPLSSGGGAVISHTDITKRINAEHELKRTFEFFRALIENGLDMVTIADTRGIIQYQSPSIERVLGYKAGELVGQNSLDFLHPRDVGRVRKVLESLQQPGMSTSPVEFSFLHKNGAWRILEGLARNAVDNPAVNGIVISSRDVTDRRRAESELRKKEAALRTTNRALRAMTLRVVKAEETERRRLSRELHDDLNQNLAIMAVDVGSLARTLPGSDPATAESELRALQARLTHVCGQVRTMAYQLHPSILDDLGLTVAVRSYCAEFSRREGIQVRFTSRNLPEQLPHELSTAVYRITQEALRNVAKHSGARTARVILGASGTSISLSVCDNGSGFGADAVTEKRGLGLTSMEERARMLGGTFEVKSRPEKGTTVTVRIPWFRGEL